MRAKVCMQHLFLFSLTHVPCTCPIACTCPPCRADPSMAKLLLVAILAVLAGIFWQLETHFAHPTQPSYETAGTATNQRMLKNLGNALDSQFDFLPKALAGLASWLTRPPGARFNYGKPDKTDDGSTPTIKMLKVCKLVCKATNFPVVVNPKYVAVAEYSSMHDLI